MLFLVTGGVIASDQCVRHAQYLDTSRAPTILNLRTNRYRLPDMSRVGETYICAQKTYTLSISPEALKYDIRQKSGGDKGTREGSTAGVVFRTIVLRVGLTKLLLANPNRRPPDDQNYQNPPKPRARRPCTRPGGAVVIYYPTLLSDYSI